MRDPVPRTGHPPSRQATSAVPLGPLTPALAWLVRDASVPLGRVAHAFGISLNYLRVLFTRQRQRRELATPDTRPLQLGVRLTREDARNSAQRHAHIEQLREQIAAVDGEYARSRDLLAGARALTALKSRPGYSGSPEWLRAHSELHQRLAWFFVHSGYVQTSILEAFAAVGYAKRARDVTRRPTDDLPNRHLQAAAALIASQAHLLRQAPSDARRWLATYGSLIPPPHRGSDYFRQLGVAHLQEHADDAAKQAFEDAALRMEQRNEASSDVEVRFTGERYVAILTANWDRARQLVADVQDLSPMHASVATHWAAATGLLSDSDDVQREARTLLQDTPDPPDDFGHQRTIRFLLQLTPELALSAETRQRWIRLALYVNAYRTN